MPHQAEGNANNVLGNLLRPMLGKASVLFESNRVIAGQSGKRPDILITSPGRSPVVIEAEYDPARTVEPEARERLGMPVQNATRPIEAAIALRYPAGVDDAYDQRAVLADAALSYCVYTVEGDTTVRFPQSGWLDGSVTDLADLVRLVSVPQNAVDRAADFLEQGINDAASILEEMHAIRPAITAEIAALLGMDNVPQTRRMACAIIANAMIFHERIAGMHEGIGTLRSVCGPDVPDPQDRTLQAWADILAINYWPIFAIGKDILERLPSDTALQVLRRLRQTAASVNGTGVNNAHDLTGRVFQRLISDRKYLATFYTLPASAALLARLAVAKIRPHSVGAGLKPAPTNGPKPPLPSGEGGGEGVPFDWSDPAAIASLRIGDFACGTGALLSAVYEQIAARHESAGGDAAAIHPMMMEEVLYGCDVMPSAIHITGSTLAGIQPDVMYGRSRLYTMPYGRQEDGTVKIGSLELLQSSQVMTLFNTSDPALRTGSAGEETAAQVNAEIPDLGFHLAIMNPPFTSNTKHYDADDGVLNAAFAAFDSSEKDQDDMAARMKAQTANTCYHGHAGLASAFAALADRKVRSGGVVAFVLPFTAINGASWAKFRELIATQYTDITIVSIAANGKDMSFSSDTGMAECLVIARRIAGSERQSLRANFVSLSDRPAGFADASEIAKAILNISGVRRLEDGPYGGAIIHIGESPVGELLNAPLGDYESGWGAARLADASVAQVAHALSAGQLWLPAQPNALELPVVKLQELGQLGVHDSYLTMKTHGGPFSKESPSRTATYPSLYNHDAKKETRLICEPDSQLRVFPGKETRAAELWATASRAHISRGFRFNSQPLAVAFTERDSLGGRAWPNVAFADTRYDYAFSMWSNSTLGLMLYWWYSSRQQAGRGEMTRLVIPLLPILDFRSLSDGQLATAQRIFDEFRELDLLPAYLADADPNRALLDRRVIRDLLGFDEEVYRAVRRLSAKWCAEPSVHGGKARPRSAVYVE